MLGVGFDAHVVHNLPFPLKKVFGKGAYVMQSMRELVRYRFPVIRLRIDDTETEAASVIISKGRLYGGGFRLAADAVPSRSRVFGGAVRRGGPRAAMMYGAALPLNLLGHAPGVRHIRARRIDFLQNDGRAGADRRRQAGCAPLWVLRRPRPDPGRGGVASPNYVRPTRDQPIRRGVSYQPPSNPDLSSAPPRHADEEPAPSEGWGRHPRPRHADEGRHPRPRHADEEPAPSEGWGRHPRPRHATKSLPKEGRGRHPRPRDADEEPAPSEGWGRASTSPHADEGCQAKEVGIHFHPTGSAARP